MSSKNISPNQREIINARDTATGLATYVTATNHKLDTNSTSTISGTPLPIAGATTAIGVAIVDSSGNQISSFGGGVQYTQGDVVSPAVGTMAFWLDDSGSNVANATGINRPLPVQIPAVVNVAISSGGVFLQDTIGNAVNVTSNALDVNITGGGGSGGTSSAFGAAFPTDGTAIGMKTFGSVMSSLQSSGLAGPTGADPDITLAITGYASNGSTVDRILAVKNGFNETGAGIQASGIVGQLDDTGTGTVTENNFAPVRISAARELLVKMISALPAGSNVIGHVITDTGSTTAVTGTVTVTATNLSTNIAQVNGATVNVGVGAAGTGTQRVTTSTDSTIGTVTLLSGTTSLTPGVAAANLGKAEDSIHGSGDTGVMALGVSNVAQSTLNADGDYSVLATDLKGNQYVNLRDTLANPVSAFPATFLRTTDEPHQLFYDAFDTAIDVTNRWTSTVGGTGVAAANTNGVMAMGTGTTNTSFSKLNSQPTFTLPIPAWLGVSDAIALPDGAAPTANSYRYWGTGTTPGSPTVAAPVTDGYGFELNTDGKLRAVVYAGGSRTVIQDLSTSGNSTQPLDAAYHRYIIYIRTDKAYWYIDGITSAQLVATSNFQSSQVQSLPRLFLCVAGAGITNTQIQCTGATAWDTGKNSVQLSDGTFPWRKQTITTRGSSYSEGPTASGVALAANPLTIGVRAATALPTAVSDAQVVNQMGDKYGRPVVLNNAIRELMGTQVTTITASTAETTIIAQAASIFNDLTAVWISNTSASATRVDIRDTTAGTIIFTLYIPAGDMRGVSLTTPWPQTTVNTNWTAQSSTNVTDLRVSALFIKNR